jgi:hypothetical protein
MPGAADTLADHEPLGEWPVIMSAMRIDRENLGSGSHQQDILITNVAEQSLGGEVGQRDTLCKIWPGGRSLLFSHIISSVVPVSDQQHFISSRRAEEFMAGHLLRRDRTHWMTAAIAPLRFPDFYREAPLQHCMRLRQFCAGIVGA